MFPWVWQCFEDISSSRNEFISNTLRIACDTPRDTGESVAQEIRPASIIDILSHPLMTIADQMFCLIDRDMVIRYISSNWHEQLHFVLPSGISFADIIAPSQRKNFLVKIQNAPVLSDPDAKACVMRVQLGLDEKKSRWYEIKSFAIGEADDMQGMLLTVRDVEEEVRRENELRKAQIRAELALKGRSEFLGHMSHELRTPLNAILGFAQMMEKGVLGEIHNQVYKDYIGNIRESGQELLHKINDLIAISSLETGDIPADEDNFVGSELVDYVMELHAHRAFSRDVRIVAEDASKHALIQGDRALLAKALANIVLNGVIHSPSGGVVSIRASMLDSGEFSLVVTDNGSGIDRERLDVLRQMLKEGESLFMGNPEGRHIGLGLAIARQYVAMHEGKIVIDSTKGEGTVVKILLPASRVSKKTVRDVATSKPQLAVG
ncbi:MAG: HAMP domain-containing sensor histidine kinase [Rickettsiales bacterium]